MANNASDEPETETPSSSNESPLTTTPTELQLLPELWLRVFQHMHEAGQNASLSRMARTCRAFKDLVMPVLWKRIVPVYDGWRITEKWNACLKEAVLSGTADSLVSELVCTFTAAPSLPLGVPHRTSHLSALNFIMHCLQSFNNLERVSMRMDHPFALGQCWIALCRLQHLRHLDLHISAGQRTEFARDISPPLLEQVDLVVQEWMGNQASNLALMIEILDHSPRLKRWSLKGPLSPSLASFPNVLSKLDSLEVTSLLNGPDNDVPETAVVTVLTCPAFNPRKLTLPFLKPFRDQGIWKLISEIDGLETLVLIGFRTSLLANGLPRVSRLELIKPVPDLDESSLPILSRLLSTVVGAVKVSGYVKPIKGSAGEGELDFWLSHATSFKYESDDRC